MRKDDLPSATPATDRFRSRWEGILERAQTRLEEALKEKGNAADAQKYAITAGISTEKVLLLGGQPTQILGGLPEHQSKLPEILARFESISGKRLFPGLPVLELPAAGDAPVTTPRPRAKRTGAQRITEAP